MTRLPILLLTAAFVLRAEEHVDFYTAHDIQAMSEKLVQKRSQFAAQDLARYGNHYTMLAERTATGSSELHEHETDVFVIESGGGTIILGGKLVNPHAQKPGEIRGSSIEGGERRRLAVGDVLNIPAGTAHQILVEKGEPITYFVIKVKGE